MMMNKRESRQYPIVLIGGFFVVLFCALSAYIAWYSYANRVVLAGNSYNSRNRIFTQQNIRGRILSADGEVLAETVTDETGEERRVYPFAEKFAHIVGYSVKGKSGIESFANYYLIRSDIGLTEKAANDERQMKSPGNDVTTTLRTDLQEVAVKALGVYKGAIIATDPRTGKILAMVSKPDFDPNTVESDWEQFVSGETNTQLLNRATQGLYPPGSTFKICSTLAYIREHPEDYADYSYHCYGSFTADGDTIHCYDGIQHGTIDFYTSFAKSCNASYANIGRGLDRQGFQRTLASLLFGRPLPTDLPHSLSATTDVTSAPETDVLQLAIGQGATTVTPLHINMITMAIANGGTLMKPYVIEAVTDAAGKTVQRTRQEQAGRLMSGEESRILREMMAAVVERGTAESLAGQPYTSGGKTGSAEYSTETDDAHAWFTCFAPVENPEICVTVLIENAGSGGYYAVPMAKRVLDQYFK